MGGAPHVRRSFREGGCPDRLATKDFPAPLAKAYPVIAMAEESPEPDYVNDLPAGCPSDTPRCQYLFQGYKLDPRWRGYVISDTTAFRGRDVVDRPCGLPVKPYPEDPEPRCYFHSTCPRAGDRGLKAQLELAVASRRYLGESHLAEAELEGAHLVKALLDYADLQGANLWGANLQGATLYDANLQGALLCDADLRDADLLSANLRGAIPSGADLRGASLLFVNLSYGYLPKAELQGTCLRGADLVNANLCGVNIALLDRIDEETGLVTTTSATLEGADLRGASLLDARIAPEANLSKVGFGFPITRRWVPWQKCGWIGLRGMRRWWRLRHMRWGAYHVRDERCARSDEEWRKIRTLYGWDEYMRRPTLADCHTLYRQLKLNYQESGDYQTAGEFFVREMECKRAQMVVENEPLWQRLSPAIMYFVCGYGERPAWIAYWALALVAFFGFIHGAFGLRDAGGEYVIGPGVDAPTWAGFGRWLTAAYFSVVTFTSLGYGDLAPGPVWGRLFAGLEAALGIVIMSLFLICIVRKYSR